LDALGALLPFVIILLAFYLLIIRPSRMRQKAALEVQRALEPGARVMTTSGIFATVVAVHDDSVSLDVAPATTMRFVKAAVARVITDDETPDARSEGDDDRVEDVDDDNRPERDQQSS